MDLWARYPGDSRHHLVIDVAIGGSLVTACRGRWPAGDAYTTTERPPAYERCDACQRTRVEHGLDELAANAPAPAFYEWPGLEDLGGESGVD